MRLIGNRFTYLLALTIGVQLIFLILSISLDPITMQGQKIFASLLASNLIILSMLLYTYKSLSWSIKGLTEEKSQPFNDSEWYALGIAFITFIILCALFI